MDAAARAELKRLFARVRNPGSTLRKQHLVPGSYLARWAADGKIRVSEVDTSKTYCVTRHEHRHRQRPIDPRPIGRPVG
jgi:hypothetical protein